MLSSEIVGFGFLRSEPYYTPMVLYKLAIGAIISSGKVQNSIGKF